MSDADPINPTTSPVLQAERMIEIAERIGFRIRYDYFGGTGGGTCEFAGTKWLFLDLALSDHERCDVIVEALVSDPLLGTVELNDEERSWFGLSPSRRAA